MQQINLLGADEPTLAKLLESVGAPSRRALDILKDIHYKGLSNISDLNVNAALREKLASVATIIPPKVALDKKASDGTRKFLIQLHDNNIVETVFIPENDRGTLCVSSQVGCMLTCSFCSTAKQGFNRNLTADEIIGQVWVAARALSKHEGHHDHTITNVVMMGMGEPLLNLDNVIPALELMMHDHAYGLAKRRVTVSTSGLVPQMDELMARTQVALAVSLHAPFDELRNTLVPINRKYPLRELVDACIRYAEHDPHKSITFEYIMIDGVNDQREHAEALSVLLKPIPSKINLIPFNPYPGTEYRRSTDESISRFQKSLRDRGWITTVRKTRGDDIDAACGQLAGQVKDKTRRQQAYKMKLCANNS